LRPWAFLLLTVLGVLAVAVAGCTSAPPATVQPTLNLSTVAVPDTPPAKIEIRFVLKNWPSATYNLELNGSDPLTNNPLSGLRGWSFQGPVLNASLGYIGVKYGPFEESYTLRVWDDDGHFLEAKSRARILPPPRLLDVALNVSSVCQGCSWPDPSRPPQFVGNGSLAAEACQGFVEGRQGDDCNWLHLAPNATGHPFLLESKGGNPAIEFRTSCDGLGQGHVQTFNHYNGRENGTVPAGSQCAVVWEESKAPSAIRLRIYSATSCKLTWVPPETECEPVSS